MGRRSTHTSAELRQLILAAARDVIESQGLSALSAREIARRIGYSAGTLYNIFDNLDDVRQTLQSEMLQDLVARIGNIAKNGDAKTYVSQILKTYVNFAFANRQLWNALFENRAAGDGLSPRGMQDSINRVVDSLCDGLAPVLPGLPREAIEQDARILWASVHGMTAIATNNSAHGINHEAAIRYADKLATTYIKGLTAT